MKNFITADKARKLQERNKFQTLDQVEASISNQARLGLNYDFIKVSGSDVEFLRSQGFTVEKGILNEQEYRISW